MLFNGWVHFTIFRDKAVCLQIKRLASLRHKSMDHCVLGAGWPHEPKFGAVAENSRPLLCDCQVGWLPWCANLDMLARTQTLTGVRTHIHTGQPAQPVDSTVLLLASVSLGHLTVQSFSCSWWLRTSGQPATTPAFTLPLCCVHEAWNAKKQRQPPEYFILKKQKWIVTSVITNNKVNIKNAWSLMGTHACQVTD